MPQVAPYIQQMQLMQCSIARPWTFGARNTKPTFKLCKAECT